MYEPDGNNGELLVRRFTLWSTEHMRISAQIDDAVCRLANKGIITIKIPPRVSGVDSLEIVRLKERIIELHQGQGRILKGLKSLGARILDFSTMEILLPGGPEDGSFISWQPGETKFLYWRKEADLASTRMLLSGECSSSSVPAIH